MRRIPFTAIVLVLATLPAAGCAVDTDTDTGTQDRIATDEGSGEPQSSEGEPDIGSVSQELASGGAASGSTWSYSCSNPAWNGYLQIPYIGRPAIPVSVTGQSLDQVTAVGIGAANTPAAQGFSVGITAKTASKITLDLRVTSAGEGGTQPRQALPIVFAYPGGTFTVNINAIPVYYANAQAYGQCTWHALSQRITAGKSEVTSYGQGIALGADPSGNAFPKAGSVLMAIKDASSRHMAYVTGVSLTATTAVSGGTQYTYAITGTQRNSDCNGTLKPLSATMVVKKSSNNVWSIVTRPVAIWPVTNIVQ